MHAIFVETTTGDVGAEEAREAIMKTAVPAFREAGATSGFWFMSDSGRGNALILFDSEEKARAAAAFMRPGAPTRTMPEVTFTSVEVCQLFAQF